MARDDDQMKLRMPSGMREQIKAAAEEHNRSMNAEIVSRLETSFNEWPKIALPAWVHEQAISYPEEEVLIFEERVRAYALRLAIETFKDANGQVRDFYHTLMSLSDSVRPQSAEEIKAKGFGLLREIVKALPQDQSNDARSFVEDILGDIDGDGD